MPKAQPLRVLQVYKDYWPVVGGIENHIRLICRGLKARHPVIEPTVLVTNTGRHTADEDIDGVRVVKAGRLATVSSAPLSVSLFAWMNRLDADLVHLHFPYPIGEMAYLIAGRGRPMVMTYHSDIVRQKVLMQFYKPFWRRVLRAARLICVSNPNYIQTSDYLRPHAAKCRVIPHGSDLRQFAPTPEVTERAEAIRAATGTPIVLFAGLLRYYKGAQYLIEAMASVPTATLLMAGAGPMEAEWRARADALGLGGRVKFVGRVSDPELRALFHACDVFCLPSIHRSESWGSVQVEALACGKPVISTELGTGTSWVNQHELTGLVVPPMDAPALAGALNRLLGDAHLRARFGAAALARAAAELDADVMVDRYAAVYREVIDAANDAGRRTVPPAESSAVVTNPVTERSFSD